jgi:hypothetical protein
MYERDHGRAKAFGTRAASGGFSVVEIRVSAVIVASLFHSFYNVVALTDTASLDLSFVAGEDNWVALLSRAL